MDPPTLAISQVALRLAIATVLGALVGLERERLERAAGLRTHAVVCVASALIMMVSAFGFTDAFTPDRLVVLDPSRIAAQVVSGIGFLGAGVIILRKNTVRGLTTAASVWAVAGVGLAVGGGLFVPAALATAFMLLIQAGLRPLERRLFVHHEDHRLVLRVRRGGGRLTTVENTVSDAVQIRRLRLRPAQQEPVDVLDLDLGTARQGAIAALLDTLHALDGVRVVSYTRGGARLVAADAADEAEGLAAEDEDIAEYAERKSGRTGD